MAEIEEALRSGLHARAATLSRALIAVSPADGAGLQLHGVALVNGGDGTEALAPMRRATWVALDSGALFNFAALLAGLARRADADRVLRRGLALSPQLPQGWELHRQGPRFDGLVDLGRICAITGSLPHELQHAALRMEVGQSGAVAQRLRSLLDGRPELLDHARLLLKSLESIARSVGLKPSSTADHFGRGLALIAAGRLEDAAALFHVDLAMNPASVGSRAAYASTIHILTDDPPPRLVVPGIGAIGVGRIGKALRLTPLDRPPAGRFLFGYNAGGVLLPEADERFRRHSNQWESRAIARMLLELGFVVDLAGLFDAWPSPESYDGVFCLHNGLARHAARLRAGCRRIMLLTGSSPDFQNAQEALRRRELTQRTGLVAPPVRSLDDVSGELASLRLADECWLFGNAVTRATYEPAVREKIRLLSPSGATLRERGGQRLDGDPRRWLWFSGHGAVLKGLDRVVEVFLGHPDWRLEIVGPAAEEPWFAAGYGRRIATSGNIFVHGVMSPISFDFEALASSCVGFLAPSASEGQSTSAITCMQAGLFPVLSTECGIDLPPGCGTVLSSSSPEEIEEAIEAVHRLPDHERRLQAETIADEARRRFSRGAFLTTLSRHLGAAVAAIAR